MAIFKKKLLPHEVVDLYFQVKEDVVALGKLVVSESPAVKDAAAQGVVDIKKDITKLDKAAKKARNQAVADLDSHEDMMAGRMDDDEYQAEFEAYEEDIIMMDFVEEDAKELLEVVDDYSKVLSGALEKARSFKDGQPQNYSEYVDYTKQAIALARGKQNAKQARQSILSDDTLTNAGMVASSVVAATNPTLGIPLMVANMVAGKRRKANKENQQDENQPING